MSLPALADEQTHVYVHEGTCTGTHALASVQPEENDKVALLDSKGKAFVRSGDLCAVLVLTNSADGQALLHRLPASGSAYVHT